MCFNYVNLAQKYWQDKKYKIPCEVCWGTKNGPHGYVWNACHDLKSKACLTPGHLKMRTPALWTWTKKLCYTSVEDCQAKEACNLFRKLISRSLDLKLGGKVGASLSALHASHGKNAHICTTAIACLAITGCPPHPPVPNHVF